MFDRGKAGCRREPCGGRHAGGLLRSRARRRGAGRARPRQPGALAGFCRRAVARKRHRRRIAARRHAGSGADRRRSGRSSRISWSFSKSSACRSNGCRPRRRARKEPHLAGKIAGAVFSPQDHQVDNRKLAAGAARRRRGSRRQNSRAPAGQGNCRAGRPRQWRRASRTARAPQPIVVVLAAGAWSRGIAGLPPDRRPPVRPVKGQMLALRMDAAAPLLNHVLWAPGAYLVPRRDGRLIVGAHRRGKRL